MFSPMLERLLPARVLCDRKCDRGSLSCNCVCKIPLRVERNKVRLRQETQLSDTDIAKWLLILLLDWYTGAGNDGIGRCLTTSPTRVWPVNRLYLCRMGYMRQDNDSDKKT